MRMKMNLPVRLKNPWFWVGLVGVILTAMGANAADFISWSTVWEALKQLVSNPYQLAGVTIAVLGVFVDPTTRGVGDSERVLAYTKPED